MKIGLIGHTGFVGSNLQAALNTPWVYHRANIHEINGQEFDLLVNAGVPSLKWKANKHPDEDWQNISDLCRNLESVRTDRFIHISSLDVMPSGRVGFEDTPIAEQELEAYGLHRLRLEKWVAAHFPKHLMLRLPHLFGRGLKKNFIFDLLQNEEALPLTDCRDVFQFYNLASLWRDISHFNDLPDCRIVNISVEPMTAREVALSCFERHFDNVCERAPRLYDMRTRWNYRFSSEAGYMYKKDETIKRLVDFRKNYKPLCAQ